MSSAHSRMFCSSCAPCCTCSCMAGTAMNTPITRHISLGHHKEVHEVSWTMLVYDRLHCAAGDTVILLIAFWLVALRWGRRWVRTARGLPWVPFLGLGLAYTVISEHVNVHVLCRWASSDCRPTVGGIGLVPPLQWLGSSRRSVSGSLEGPYDSIKVGKDSAAWKSINSSSPYGILLSPLFSSCSFRPSSRLHTSSLWTTVSSRRYCGLAT